MTRTTRLHPDGTPSSSDMKEAKQQYHDNSQFDDDEEGAESNFEAPTTNDDDSHNDQPQPTSNNNNNNNNNNMVYVNTNNVNVKQQGQPSNGAADDDVQLPQFIASLHELISDPVSDHIVTWLPLPDGRVHFVVKDVDSFTQNILPKYYRTHKMTSFMRQLNNYGFSKVKSTDQNDKTYEFEHELNQLQPNRPDLLYKIERRRAVKRGGNGAGGTAKRARPSGQQLFRITTNYSGTANASPSISPRGTANAADPATDSAQQSTHERDLEMQVANLQAQLNAQKALMGGRGNHHHHHHNGATDDDGDDDDADHSADRSGVAKRRPLRSASLAARSAIKAAVQDIDEGDDVVAAVGGAADESSDFDDSPTASFDEQQRRQRASMSQVALAERGQTQLQRLRLHDELPLTLESLPPVTTAITNNGVSESFSFAVPQPQQQPTTAPHTFAFSLAPQTAAAANQPPKVVVQARVGLTKSGEVWKSMIQSAVVEQPTSSTNVALPTAAVLFDMPRNNSTTDFFGMKREAAENALDTDFLDMMMPDDSRAFLKNSSGVGL